MKTVHNCQCKSCWAAQLWSCSDKHCTMRLTSANVFNACKAEHKIHDFQADSSPISSCLKYITVLFPHSILWRTRLVQQLTCIIKFCIVFSNIYQPIVKGSLCPSHFHDFVGRNEQHCFPPPSPIWINLHFMMRSSVPHMNKWGPVSPNRPSTKSVFLICSVFNKREKKREDKREKENERESKLQRLQVFHIT